MPVTSRAPDVWLEDLLDDNNCGFFFPVYEL